MRPSCCFAALFLLAACLEPPHHAPEPLNLTSSQPPREVVQRAALALAQAGFQVTQADSLGEAIAASRVNSGLGNEVFVTCLPPRNSIAAANRATTLRIRFAARPSERGSDLHIFGTVLTTYPGFDGTAMAVPANETDCVSNGTMERRLAEMLR